MDMDDGLDGPLEVPPEIVVQGNGFITSSIPQKEEEPDDEFPSKLQLVSSTDKAISFTPLFQPKWEWRIFGGDALVIQLCDDVSWVRRKFMTWLLGSKWRRIEPKESK